MNKSNVYQSIYAKRKDNSNRKSTESSINLDEYILEMEARSSIGEQRTADGGDVWAQLQQKDSDILLAAELGKALLEKNEDLVKQHEQLIEDYSAKIEVSSIQKYKYSNNYI